MPTIADLRAAVGDSSNRMSDEELLAAYAKGANMSPNQAAMEFGWSPSNSGQWGNRAGAAIDSYQANLYGLGEALGSDWARRKRIENEFAADVSRDRAAAQGAISSYKDIGGVGDFFNYAGGLALDSAPYLGEALVGGGVGGLAARGLGLAGRAASRTAGAVAASYPSAVGDVLSNQRDQAGVTDFGSAAALGVPYALANAFGVEGALARGAAMKSGIRALDDMTGLRGGLARTGASVAKGAVTEAPAETFQEFMNQYGRMAVDPNETFFNERSNERFAESAVGGGVLGGMFGGGMGGWRRSNQWYADQQSRALAAAQAAQQEQQEQQQEVNLLAPEVPKTGEQFSLFGSPYAPPMDDAPPMPRSMEELLAEQARIRGETMDVLRQKNAAEVWFHGPEGQLQNAAASNEPGQRWEEMASQFNRRLSELQAQAASVSAQLEPYQRQMAFGDQGGQMGLDFSRPQFPQPISLLGWNQKREEPLLVLPNGQAVSQEQFAAFPPVVQNYLTALRQPRVRPLGLSGTTLPDVININPFGQAGATPQQNQVLLADTTDLGTELARQRIAQGYTAPTAPATGKGKAAPAAPAVPTQPKQDTSWPNRALWTQYGLPGTSPSAARGVFDQAVQAKANGTLDAEGFDRVVEGLRKHTNSGRAVLAAETSRVQGEKEQAAKPSTAPKAPKQPAVVVPAPAAPTGENQLLVQGAPNVSGPNLAGQPTGGSSVAGRADAGRSVAGPGSNPVATVGSADPARGVAPNDGPAATAPDGSTQGVSTAVAAPAPAPAPAPAAPEKKGTVSQRLKAAGKTAVEVGVVNFKLLKQSLESEDPRMHHAVRLTLGVDKDGDRLDKPLSVEAAAERAGLRKNRSELSKVLSALGLTRDVRNRFVNGNAQANERAEGDIGENDSISTLEAEYIDESEATGSRRIAESDNAGSNAASEDFGREGEQQTAGKVSSVGGSQSNTAGTPRRRLQARKFYQVAREKGLGALSVDELASVAAQAAEYANSDSKDDQNALRAIFDEVRRKRITDRVSMDRALAAQNKRPDPEQETSEDNDEKFGTAKRAKGPTYTKAELENEVKAFVRVGALGRSINIVEDVNELLNSPLDDIRKIGETLRDPSKYGVYANNRVWIIANRIEKGNGRASFMHEVGVHLGLERLLPKATFNSLVDKIVGWADRNDGSQESKIARAALARVPQSTPDDDVKSETLAYFVEEAMKAGIDPTANVQRGSAELRSWFTRLWAAFKTALLRLGFKPDAFTAQDIVNLAFGAARLEAAGTWHGTAADFKNFLHKYMNSGEGAQAYGWGTYLAQRKGIGKGYFEADVRRKTVDAKTSVKYNGVEAGYIRDSSLNGAVVSVMDHIRIGKTLQQAIETVVGNLGRRVDSIQKSVDSARRNNLPGLPDLEESLEWSKEDLKAAKDLDPTKFEVVNQKRNTPDGSLMRVDISVGDNETLDWDAPLLDQPDAVVDFAAKEFPGNTQIQTGGDLYKALIARAWKDMGIKESWRDGNFADKMEAKKRASEALDAAGIKALKFLDNSSRAPDTAESQKTRNLVVFNDKNIHRVATLTGADRQRTKFGTTDADSMRAYWQANPRGNPEDRWGGSSPNPSSMWAASKEKVVMQGDTSVDEEMSSIDDKTSTALRLFDKADKLLRAGDLKDAMEMRQKAERILHENAVRLENGGQLPFGAKNALPPVRYKFGTNAAEAAGYEATRARFDALNKALPPRTRTALGDIATVIKTAMGSVANRVVFTHDLIDRAKRVGLASAEKFGDLYKKRAQMTNNLSGRVDNVVRLYSEVPDAERGRGQGTVNDFIKDSTRTDAWGFVPDWLPEAKRASIKVDPAMAQRFAALSPQSQAFAKAVFEHGYKTLERKKNTILKLADTEYAALIKAARDAGDEQELARLEADQKKAQTKFETLFKTMGDNPYAPLKRFGNWVVIAESKALKQARADNDDKRIEELEQSGQHYYVDFFESQMEALAAERQLRATDAYDTGAEGVVVRKKEEARDRLYGGDGMAAAFTKLRNQARMRLEGEQDVSKRALLEMATDMYLSALAEASARKSEMRRRGIEGDIDMVRSFVTQGYADAHMVSALAFSGVQGDEINAMRREKDSGSSAEQTRKSAAFNEIVKRHADSMEYREPNAIDNIKTAASLYYLAFSPAYYLQNLTQPWMVSLPTIAGRHDWGKTAAAIGRAGSELKDAWLGAGVSQAIDLSKVPADVREAMQTLYDRGILTSGMNLESRRVRAAGETGLYGRTKETLGDVREFIDNVQTKVEVMNRTATAMAAYRLELAKGASVDQALKYADDIVRQTHGDYSMMAAPRFFNHDFGKLALQFRKYQLLQVSLMARLVRESFTGTDRAAARWALGFVVGQAGLLAGAMGLPGFTAIAWLISKLFGDPDEPDDPEYKLRKAIGNKEIADLILKGVPARFGADLSNKLGWQNALSILPYTDIDFTKKSFTEIGMALTMGPAGAMGAKMFDAMDAVSNGRYVEGLTKALPSGFGNAIKGADTFLRGVRNKDGELLLSPDEINFAEAVLAGVGITPTELSAQSFRQRVNYKATTNFADRASKIKQEFVDATREGGSRQEAIDAWNKLQAARARNGFEKQPLQDLYKAVQDARKQERNTVNGVQYRTTNRQFAEDLGRI